MTKSKSPQHCQTLISILKECNIIFLIVDDRSTMSNTTMFFVKIKGKTWVFEVNELGKWQYEYNQKWEPLNNTVSKVLLADRVKYMKEG